MFAQAFKLKKWNGSIYKPLEYEYPDRYFTSIGEDRGKVVIKIVVEDKRKFNLPDLSSSILKQYLGEASRQTKLFNEVYGPQYSRKEIPLSPAIPYTHFGILANHLPQDDRTGRYFNQNIFSTLGEYFYNMKDNLYTTFDFTESDDETISKLRFIEEFRKNYNKGLRMQGKYRMSMTVMEYAGKTLNSMFYTGQYSLMTKTSLPVDTLRRVLLPILFQLLHTRVLLNKLGYIHADLKADNVLGITLSQASIHNMYHTRTEGTGELKEPLFVIDIPPTSFASSIWSGSSNRIVVSPHKNFVGNLDRGYAILIKLIDFGLSVDRKIDFEQNLTVSGDSATSGDVSAQSNPAYARNYRPPEAYFQRGKISGERIVHLYHLSDTYAMGIVLLELVLGEYIMNLASYTSIANNWSLSYRKVVKGKLADAWTSRRHGERGWLLLHYYIRYLLFVCLEEMRGGGLKDRKQYNILKKIDKDDYNKYFVIRDTNMAQYIDWNYGGVITQEQHRRLMELSLDEKQEEITRLGLSMSIKEFTQTIRSAGISASKAKERIKGILGEYGIYMILKMIHSDPLKRSWSKEVLVEQLGENGIFNYMIVPEHAYYDRLMTKGIVDGISTYNLGLYKLSLDIARPYSQARMPSSGLEEHTN